MYTYFIYERGTDNFKIGATGDENREKSLQTGNPRNLRIMWLLRTNYHFKLETLLHSVFAPYKADFKGGTEWFTVPDRTKVIRQLLWEMLYGYRRKLVVECPIQYVEHNNELIFDVLNDTLTMDDRSGWVLGNNNMEIK